MLTRRHFVTGGLVALAGCRPERGNGFEGHAFVANEEGSAVAAVNLTAFAVTRHIRVDGRPTRVVAHPEKNAVWAMTESHIHEIDPAKLEFRRKIALHGAAVDMRLDPKGESLWVLTRGQNRATQFQVDGLSETGAVALPAEPVAFDFARREALGAAVLSDGAAVVFRTKGPAASATRLALPYAVTLAAFRSDGKQLMVAGGAARQASFLTVPDGRTVAHLPLAIEPRALSAKPDGGEMYLTGAGLDAVVVLYPYLAEVGETVLAGKGPAAMAAVSIPELAYLFVANPESGNVTILDITTHKLVGAVSVGKEPAFLTITPDNQYALVLNRASGDMGVIRVKSVTRNRGKSAPLFTMIPVGSRPVAAAVRGV
ncbi:MAG: hypothetical protein FJW30_13750 [Acidobacteria bacterium]|nr:hypothetical protein [Acidobacteriota bacterium]